MLIPSLVKPQPSPHVATDKANLRRTATRLATALAEGRACRFQDDAENGEIWQALEYLHRDWIDAIVSEVARAARVERAALWDKLTDCAWYGDPTYPD